MKFNGRRFVEPVQHVAAQRMTGRKVGVVEIIGRIPRHCKLLHDAAGAHIRGNREGNEFLQAQLAERIFHYGACAFGGQSAAPVFLCQPP